MTTDTSILLLPTLSLGMEPRPLITSDSKSNTLLSELVRLVISAHATLDFWTLMNSLEPIEHDYVRRLMSQSYKQMPVSPERRVLHLESEVKQSLRFNLHRG